jgi:hypothetical protein
VATARDFVTILYQPRETIRRVLAEPKRWTWQLVAIAAVCASIDDPDLGRLRSTFPTLSGGRIALFVAGGVAGAAVGWIVMLFLLTWLAAFVGRLLGGSAPVRNVRTALAWATVPVIWLVPYRIPAAIYRHYALGDSRIAPRELFANFLANGGCSILLIAILIKFGCFLVQLWIASSTLAEVQGFPTIKGAANLAITLIAPLVIAAAAVFAFRNG